MTTQTLWNNDDVMQLHNFDKIQSSITYTINEEELPPPISDIEKVIEVPTKLPLEEPDPIPIPIPVPQPQAPKDDKPKSKYRSLNRSMFYCLLAEYKETKDELYGEVVKRLTYTEAFRFQGAVVQQNDIQCFIWTTVKQVTPSSIIYQPEFLRWWKVSKIYNDENQDGYLLETVISDLQPDFSSVT